MERNDHQSQVADLLVSNYFLNGQYVYINDVCTIGAGFVQQLYTFITNVYAKHDLNKLFNRRIIFSIILHDF